MFRIVLIALLWFFGIQLVQAQVDDESRNALPAGPARVSGYVLQNGKPVENAVVRLEYCLNSERQQRDFQIYGGGEYTVYINDESTEVVIKVLVNGEVADRFEPQYYHEGSVQRKIFELSQE